MPNIVKTGAAGNVIEPYKFTEAFDRKPASAEEVPEEEPGGEHSHADDREEEILTKALKQAEEILNTARSEAVKIRQEAHDIGYEEGFKEGQKEGYVAAFQENEKAGEAQRQAIEEEVNEFLESASGEKQKLLDAYLEDLKDLAVAVGEKVIQVSLKSSGEVIKRMIIAATDTLKQRQWVKVYIAKCDAVFLSEVDAALLKALSHLSDNVKIVAMEEAESGTCIVELPDEIIDASVSSQMENIKEIISNARI